MRNNNQKIVISTNGSLIAGFILLLAFASILLFTYYVQFNIEEAKSRRIIHYYFFGKKFGIQITILFIFINYLIFRIFKGIIPRLYQIYKYPQGFLSHDVNNLYFGDDVIALRDIDKCVNDHSVEFKNPRHKLLIHNKFGKIYECEYVFKEDPKQLMKQIEELARNARAETTITADGGG